MQAQQEMEEEEAGTHHRALITLKELEEEEPQERWKETRYQQGMRQWISRAYSMAADQQGMQQWIIQLNVPSCHLQLPSSSTSSTSSTSTSTTSTTSCSTHLPSLSMLCLVLWVL
jgi:hypothetical protein